MDYANLNAEQKQKLMLALKACIYAAATNKKWAGADYVCDIKKLHGGPYIMPFDDAIGLVAELAESLESPETWPDSPDKRGQLRTEEGKHD